MTPTSTPKFLKAILFVLLAISGLKGWGQTNNYFGTSGTVTGNVWSTNIAGPYTSSANTTGGWIMNFNNAGALTWATLSTNPVQLNFNAQMTWTAGGTIGSSSNTTINIASGINIDAGSQSFTTSTTGSFTKNGAGSFATTGGTYQGGFILNDGTLIARGVNAMGGNATPGPLTINGGTIAANANRDLTGKYSGITIGGDFSLGSSTVGISSGTANLTFSNNVALGTATRTITLGGTGSYTLGGVISGTSSAGLSLGSGSTSGTLVLTGVNTYPGNTTINGGTLSLSGSGSIANSPQIIIASGGTFNISGRSAALTLGATQSLRSSATGSNTTATVTVGSTPTLTLSAGGLAFTAYGGANGNSVTNAPITVTGAIAGALALNSAPVTITTTSALAAGTYILIAKGGSATGVTGTPGALTISGSGLAGGTIGALSVVGGELILTVTATTPTISASSATSPTSVSTIYGTASGEASFNVSGANMSAGISVTPPSTNFEVSLTSGGTFTNTVTVGTSGTIASTPVYIRLKQTAPATSYSGNIVLSSTNATSVNVPIASSTVSAKALTMSGLTVPASKTYDATTTAVVGGTPALQAAQNFGTGTASDGKPYTGDVVSFTGTATGTYNSKDVATAASVTFGGLSLTGAAATNYTLTIQSAASATITAKALTYTGLSVPASRPYNGLTSATASGTAALQAAQAPGAGSTADGIRYTGDVVSITGTPTAAYNFKDVSTATLVTFGGVSLTGAQATNYSLTAATQAATITTASFTVTASNVTKTEGNTLTSGSSTTGFTTTTLQNGESVGSVTLTYGPSGDAAAAPGTYTGDVVPSAATPGTFTPSNYNISYVAGDVTVISASTPNCPASTSIAPTSTQTVCQGAFANQLTATVILAGSAGTPTLQYQWYYNTTNSNTVSGATLISGATLSTYTPLTTSAEVGDRYYFCVGYAADNSCGQTNATQSLASNVVQLTVRPLPTATIAVSGSPVCVNGTQPVVTFTGANGTAPYTFTYTLNNGANQTITTTSGNSVTLNVPVTAGGTFTYQLVSVAGQFCSQTQTGSAVATVNGLPTATISGTTAVCQNATAPTIAFTGTGGTAPYTFTYNINGGSSQTVTSGGGTNPQSATVTAPTGTTGTFAYNLTNVSGQNCPNAQTGTATITVRTLPTATITGNTTVCQNATAPNITFTGANGTAPYTFTYTINNGSNLTATTTSGNSVTVAVPTTTAGTFIYDLVSITGQNCSQTQSGSAAVTVSPTIGSNTVSSAQSICNGATPTGLSGTTPTGGSGTYTFLWESSTTNASTGFATASGTSNGQNYTPGALTATTWYRRTVTSGGCTGVSAAIEITVNPVVTYGTVSTTSTVNHLVISQVYGGGGNTGATYQNDFIEIFNPTNSTISLSGWSVQQTSNSGTSWGVTALSGSIPAGAYYLVRGASGGAVGALLPTADATGTFNMSVTGTKVLLSNSTGAATGGCPTGTTIIDFVGVGTADCKEGSGTAPAHSNTTADIRALNGCTDADNNSTDFTTGPPNPRNSSSAANICSGTSTQTICSGSVPSGMSVSGASGSSFNYQWYSQAGTPLDPTGTTIPSEWISLGTSNGANTATYTPTTGLTATTKFACFVTPTGTPNCGTGTWASGTRQVTVNALPTITGTLTVCAGSTTQLTGSATAAATNPWVSATTGVATINSTGLVTGVAAGTSIITYNNTNGCSNTATVTVNALPSAGTLSGTQGVCSNGTTTFSSTVPGGVWSSGSTSIATIDASTGVITPGSAGTSTITYTVTGSGCTNSATRTVTVTTAPNAGTLSGTQSVCVNGTTTFSTTGSGGSWTSSNTAIATVVSGTGVITGVSAGTATITYTVTGTGGCINATATRDVTVNALPTISGTLTLCSNATTQLTGSGTAAASNPWVSATPSVASVNGSGLVTGVSAGASVITYTNNNGCSNSATVTVTAAPPISASASLNTVCSGTSINLFSTSSTTSTLLSENFNSGTNSWTRTNNSTGGTIANAAWTLRSNGYDPAFGGINSNDASQFYLSNSDAQGSGTTATILRSPSFSTVGLSSLTLDFYHYLEYNSGETAKVEVSTNNTTWTTVATYSAQVGSFNSFAHPSINLNSYVGNSTLYVRFKYDATFDYWWAIDNVTVTGATNSSINWTSNPTGFNSTNQNPTGVVPTTTTTYTATATANGCSSSANVVVTVNPLPTATIATSSASVCQNATSPTITFTGANGTAPYTFTYTLNGVSQPTITTTSGNSVSLSVPTATTGTFTYALVSVAGQNCSQAQTGSVAVTVNPLPTATIATSSASVCQNATSPTITFTGANGTAPYTFTYTLNGVSQPTITTTSGNSVSLSVPTTTAGTFTYALVSVAGQNCSQAQTGSAAVAINPLPTVTVSSPTVCVGSSATLTATPGSAGTYNYAWTVPSGATAPGNVASFTTTTAGTYSVVITNTTTNCASASASGTVTVTNTNTFTGSGNFSTPGRWSCGVAPTSGGTTDVVISGAAILDVNFAVGTGGSFTLSNTGTLGSLDINPNIVLSGEGTINFNTQSVYIKSTADGTGSIGQLTTSGNNLTGATNVSVERYISSGSGAGGNRAYRQLGPTVTTNTSIRANWQEAQNNTTTSSNSNTAPNFGMHITGATNTLRTGKGFDATQSGGASMYTLNSGGTAWVPIDNTNVTTMQALQPYLVFIRGSRSVDLNSATPVASNTTLRTTGTLLAGNQTLTGLKDGTYNFITNPFASAINWGTIYRSNGTSRFVGSDYVFYDPNIGSRGSYVTVQEDGTVIASNGEPQPIDINALNIQSGQAFWVQPKTGFTSIVIREADKSSANNRDVFRTNDGSIERLQMSLYTNLTPTERRIMDGVAFKFGNNYSAAIGSEDASKFTNFDEEVAVLRNGVKLSIEGRPLVDQADTLPVYMAKMQQRAYEWQLDPSNFNVPGLMAYLQDKFLGTETQISLSKRTIVPFTVTSNTATSASDRFKVVFRSIQVLPINFTNVKAFEKGTRVQVEWNLGTEEGVKQYEIETSADGRTFTKGGTQAVRSIQNTSNYVWMHQQPNSGSNYYRIKAIEQNGQYRYSQVVSVKLGRGNSTITVYPNPITDNTINVQLVNQPAGKYSIKLLNQLGQEVYRRELNHIGGSATEALQIDTRLSKGVYNLQVTGKGKTTVHKVVAQ